MTPHWNVVLAVEDEHNRRTLHRVVQKERRFRVLAEAGEGTAALDLLDKLRPDLVFLDVGLPGLSGPEVLRALPARRWPLAIFCVHSDPGVDVQGGAAVFDTLTQPLAEGDVAHALGRAAELLRGTDPDRRSRIERALAAFATEHFVERIAVRRAGRVDVVELDDVDWIGAAGNYVELHCNGRRYLYRSPLSRLIDRLDPERFVRIHRSTVVSVARVRELEPTPQGDFRLRLDSGAQLRLSRRFRSALHHLTPRS